jgi:hypothetical protein
VRDVSRRYGIPYNTGPLHSQFGSVVRKIVTLAVPPRRWLSKRLGSVAAPFSGGPSREHPAAKVA